MCWRSLRNFSDSWLKMAMVSFSSSLPVLVMLTLKSLSIRFSMPFWMAAILAFCVCTKIRTSQIETTNEIGIAIVTAISKSSINVKDRANIPKPKATDNATIAQSFPSRENFLLVMFNIIFFQSAIERLP